MITPNIGLIYTGGKKKVAEHGGFAHDDTNVTMLFSNLGLRRNIVTSPLRRGVRPTILDALHLNPSFEAVFEFRGAMPTGVSVRFDPAQRLSPTNFEQNATMKDTSVHEDPTLLRVGVSRQQIAAAFGAPNETSNLDGVIQDVYDFNPDGSKFVKPKVYPRNIAAGVFTGGIATVVHQGRIHYAEEQLTVYSPTYGPTALSDCPLSNCANSSFSTIRAFPFT